MSSAYKTRKGFTLAEVLFAVLILGIGLVMLAAALPVGADFYRQSSDESIGVYVGELVRSLVVSRYTAADLASTGTSVVILPNIHTRFPDWHARAYTYNPSYTLNAVEGAGGGTEIECVRKNGWPAWVGATAAAESQGMAANCPLVKWFVLLRRQPGQPATSNGSGRYDLYVLVCKKNEPLQTFGTASDNSIAAPTLPYTTGRFSGYPNGGDPVHPTKTDASNNPYFLVPRLDQATVAGGKVTAAAKAGMRMVGVTSGVVFRVLDDQGNTSVALPNETAAWYVPAADGLDSRLSPLVYVYATTVAF